MKERMAEADLVVCRAGAMTLTEIAAMKKAAILIPSPYVAYNHQYYNAKALSDVGAAVLVEEANLSSGLLTRTIEELAQNGHQREQMEAQIGAFAAKDANKEIWEQILEMIEK